MKIDKLFKIPECEALYNGRIKQYGSKSEISLFSRQIFNPYGHEFEKPKNKIENSVRKSNVSSWEEEIIRQDNIKRAQDKLKEICYANEFDKLLTLTLDATKIDSRTDISVIYKYLRIWLSNMVQRHNMNYALVGEPHKKIESDGKKAIHFHALVNGDFDLKNSGKRTERGQEIYNIENWKFGFSTAVILDSNVDAAIGYILKYITKDSERIFKGRYFLSGGKNLKRSVDTQYFNGDYSDFDGKEYYIEPAKMSVKYQTIGSNLYES